VLLSYWDELIAGQNLFVFDFESSFNKTLEKIFKNKPGINAKNAMYLGALWASSKEGIRETRAIIEQHATRRTWYRMAQDLPFLDEISGKTYHGWLKQVHDGLKDFVPFRLSTP
jgi:hypothetical protein